jgi:hypothetical protein
LNTDGGTIYFGVEDDGYIAGIHIGRKERDLLRLRIDAAISAYRPQVDPDIVKVDFVPVLFPEKDTKPRERNSASRFVVVVRVYKGSFRLLCLSFCLTDMRLVRKELPLCMFLVILQHISDALEASIK